LRTQHPVAFTRFKKEKDRFERGAAGAKLAIDECYDNLESKIYFQSP
jgi:hypothetical protein